MKLCGKAMTQSIPRKSRDFLGIPINILSKFGGQSNAVMVLRDIQPYGNIKGGIDKKFLYVHNASNYDIWVYEA
jgi:hypothetical protein